VGDFGDGFFEDEKRQHFANLPFALRIGGTTVHRPVISGAKAFDGTMPPGFGELRHPRFGRRARRGEVLDRGFGCVV
jgi:hypothetical protein